MTATDVIDAESPRAGRGVARLALARSRATALMRGAMSDGILDHARLRRWLLGSELHVVLGAKDPYETVLETLGVLEKEHPGEHAWRDILAEALARLIDSRFEGSEAAPGPAELVFNAYRLALVIERPQLLHRAIADAVRRGLPTLVGPWQPYGRFLFDAAVANQAEGQALKDFWFALMGAEVQDGEVWRGTDWGATREDAWIGLVSMKRRWDSDGSIRPSAYSVIEGLRLLKKTINEAYGTNISQKREIFTRLVTQILNIWAGKIDAETVKKFVLRAQAADFYIPTVYEDPLDRDRYRFRAEAFYNILGPAVEEVFGSHDIGIVGDLEDDSLEQLAEGLRAYE